MKITPLARLRRSQGWWYIYLEYKLKNRNKQFEIGPYEPKRAAEVYESGAKSGRWIKEELGDR